MDMEQTIGKMMENLVQIPEERWGRYAFLHEPLERKFCEEQKKAYTGRAIECGRREADLFLEKWKESSVKEAVLGEGMKLLTPDTPAGGGHVLFAQYVEPDEITVFMDCVSRAEHLIEEQQLQQMLAGLNIYELLLAHEFFHYIEYKKEKEIYTQTEKIELWRKPFSNRSKIVCLSEIAAMAFAKRILNLSYSPYIMDVLLVYSYNKEAAIALYEEIMDFCGEQEESC